MAVSGDVHADFWDPTNPLNINYCAISASAIAFGGRKDGVIILARQEQREANQGESRKSGKMSYRTKHMGPNHFIDPGMNSRELATELLRIADQQDKTEMVRLTQGVSCHSRTAGVLALPSPIVRSPADAELARVAVEAVMAAASADASIPNRKPADIRQMTLFEALQNQDVRGGKPCMN